MNTSDDSNRSSKTPRLSTAQLLQMEDICDRFEADYCRLGAVSPEDYLRDVPADLQIRVAEELRRLSEHLQHVQRSQITAIQSASTLDKDKCSSNVVGSDKDATLRLRAGRFELHESLGRGAMGEVWKAYDRHLQRWVAFKVPLAKGAIDTERFQIEARAAACLNHPGIVRILDAGQDEDGCFIVSEWVEGRSLASKLKHHRFAPREAADLVSQIADAVAYAHQSGIVHRDLKPQNIIIDVQGRPLVLDFGLACHWLRSGEQDSLGKLLGTPAYMAPEQATVDPAQIEPRTDVYSLGVILFQLLTDELPFRGDVASILHQLLHIEPPQCRDLNPTIPVELNTLCQRCLEKQPASRLASAAFLRDELQRYVRHEPIHSRPASWETRLGKWIYRNPVVASLTLTAVAMFGLLMIGTTVTAIVISQAWQREYDLRIEADRQRADAIEARDSQLVALQAAIQAEASAQQARHRAQAEALLSETSLQFLESMIESSDPVSWVLHTSIGPVSEAPNLGDWLDAAAQRARSELSGQPRIQARVLDTIANGARSLGKFEQARNHLDQAERLRDGLKGSAEECQPLELARHRFYRGVLLQDLGELNRAESILLDALQQTALQQDEAALLLRADIHFHLGWNYGLARNFSPAREQFQQSLTIREKLCPHDSGLVKASQVALELCSDASDELLSLNQLQRVVSGSDRYSQLVQGYLRVLALRQFGDWQQAMDAYQNVLDPLVDALPPKHPLIVLARGEYAELCWRAGNFKRALPVIQETVRLAEELAPQHVKLRQVREILGSELLRAQRFEEAGQQFQQLIKRDQAVGDRFSTIAYEGLAWVHILEGRKSEGLSIANELVKKTDSHPAYQRAWYYYVLARAAATADDRPLQEASDARSLELADSLTSLPDNGLWLERLANVFTRHDRLDRSLKLLEEAIATERKTKPSSHPHLADRWSSYANVLKRAGLIAEAQQAYQTAHAIYLQSLPDDDVRLKSD